MPSERNSPKKQQRLVACGFRFNPAGEAGHRSEINPATLKDRPFCEVQFDPFLWWPGDRGYE
jgi:hypothetical protein